MLLCLLLMIVLHPLLLFDSFLKALKVCSEEWKMSLMPLVGDWSVHDSVGSTVKQQREFIKRINYQVLLKFRKLWGLKD